MNRPLAVMLVSLGAFGAAMSLSRFARLRDPWDLAVWIMMTIVIPVAGLIGTWSYAAREIREKGLGWQPAISLMISLSLLVVGVLMLGVRG